VLSIILDVFRSGKKLKMVQLRQCLEWRAVFTANVLRFNLVISVISILSEQLGHSTKV
jgi:hypothetical protein